MSSISTPWIKCDWKHDRADPSKSRQRPYLLRYMILLLRCQTSLFWPRRVLYYLSKSLSAKMKKKNVWYQCHHSSLLLTNTALPRQKEVKDKIKFSNYEAKTAFYTDHCLLFIFFVQNKYLDVSVSNINKLVISTKQFNLS